MIRGPVLPQSREALWSLVVGRLESIERGLTLVFEGFDCSEGQLGAIDGLARDAAGEPVLVLLAMDGDALLVARALAAVDFLARVGGGLGPAVPEAAFCVGARGRVLVIAVERHGSACEVLARQSIAGLQVCRLEPFRVAGSERFAIRWFSTPHLAAPLLTGDAAATVFAVPPHLQAMWSTLHDLCLRIDPGIRIDGDRFRRRLTWNGHGLAEVDIVDGSMHGVLTDGSRQPLAAPADVRSFVDQVMRGYSRLAGLTIPRASAEGAAPASGRDTVARHVAKGQGAHARSSGDSLRSVAAAARLTAEECSALGESAPEVGSEPGGGATADDVVRSVAAPESSWPLPGRPD